MALRRVSDKIALIAGPFLVVYLLALLLTTYLAQADLRDASLREAQYRLDLRAAALGHFHAARIQEIEALTEDPVLHNYFANRALGMSMQYGMRASQLAVQARVDHLLRDHRLGGAPVYRRLSLIENDGGVVVDRTAAEGAPLPWDARLADAVKRPQLRLLRSGGIDRLAVVAPYLFKGVRVATLIAEVAPAALSNELGQGGRRGPIRYEILLRPDEQVIDLGGEAASAPAAEDGLPLSQGVGAGLDGYLRRSVPDSPFVLAANPTPFLAQDLLTSRWYLAALAVVAVLVSGLMFAGFRAGRRAERAMAMAKETAEAATRAKSDFLASMSHEIRTPMNAVIGLSRLALQAEPGPQLRDYLQRISRSAHALLGVLNDILDLSKIEAGKIEMEAVDFRLEDVIDNLEDVVGYRAHEKGLAFEVTLGAGVPTTLVGDSLRLAQVLINLGNNAVKFTPSGGVVVSVEATAADSAEAELQFCVRDTGIGLTEDQRAGLFRPFQQADASINRRFGGTGLGLAISRRLVALMGGEIWVESAPGEGSRFCFTARLRRQQGHVSARRSLSGNDDERIRIAAAGLRGARLLLVDDDQINRELAVELLHANGIEVETAVNGAEALIRLNGGHFDGVLMDCQMPVMNGSTATRHIRTLTRLRDLPVIAMTASAMDADRQRALDAGMNDHVSKPIDVPHLFETLARWIRPTHPGPAARAAAAPGDDGPLPDLPGIDAAAGLAVAHGNRDLFRRLLLMFHDRYAEFGSLFREALEDPDPMTAERLAHSLKGVASNLGAERLRSLAQALEHTCADGSNPVEPALAAVIAELDRVMPAIVALRDRDTGASAAAPPR